MTAEPTYQQLEEPGISLRDYFAAQALAALLHPTHCARLAKEPGYSSRAAGHRSLASGCYVLADAMLVAREEKP